MSNSKINDLKQNAWNWWEKQKTDQVDLFRETAIRYCGYANEVGESFRPLIPKKIVNLSYGIAISYVIADCTDKTIKTYRRPEVLGGNKIIPAAKIAGDVFFWQMLASVIVPGLVINRITWAAGKACQNSKFKGIAKKWLPTCIGLAAIPFIIKPIDQSIDYVMDNTYRKYV